MNDVQKQSASGLAIAALVTGILQMGIVPIILGAIDLGKIKKGESSIAGKGMDIAGIVLGAISLVWILIVGIVWAVAATAAAAMLLQ
jgi:hypothetical protein